MGPRYSYSYITTVIVVIVNIALVLALVACNTKKPVSLDEIQTGYSGEISDFEAASMEKAGLSGSCFLTLNLEETDKWSEYWTGYVVNFEGYLSGVDYTEKDEYYGLPEASVLIYEDDSEGAYSHPVAQAYCVKAIKHKMRYVEDLSNKKGRVRGLLTELGESKSGRKLVILEDAEYEIY